jgi:ABC-type antimicrobial peptide transport system permease subunit
MGKRIKIMGRNLTIIGVLKKEGDDMLGTSADKQILIPVNLVRNLIDLKSENYRVSIVVKGKDGYNRGRGRERTAGYDALHKAFKARARMIISRLIKPP